MITTEVAGVKWTYSPSANAGYIYVNGGPVDRTIEVEPGAVLVDIDKDNQVVGVETIGTGVAIIDLVRVLRRCQLVP